MEIAFGNKPCKLKMYAIGFESLRTFDETLPSMPHRVDTLLEFTSDATKQYVLTKRFVKLLLYLVCTDPKHRDPHSEDIDLAKRNQRIFVMDSILNFSLLLDYKQYLDASDRDKAQIIFDKLEETMQLLAEKGEIEYESWKALMEIIKANEYAIEYPMYTHYFRKWKMRITVTQKFSLDDCITYFTISYKGKTEKHQIMSTVHNDFIASGKNKYDPDATAIEKENDSFIQIKFRKKGRGIPLPYLPAHSARWLPRIEAGVQNPAPQPAGRWLAAPLKILILRVSLVKIPQKDLYSMRRIGLLIAFGCLVWAHGPALVAQQHLLPDPDTAPLAELERHLMPIANDVLRNPEYSRKLAQNQRLQEYLKRILLREDSYDYGFDSLNTISRLFPADQSFRIFTWQVVQHDTAHNLREHAYYGFVQRKYVRQDGTTEIIVIPLEDKMNWHSRIEAEEHSHDNWLGALYYKPAHSSFGVMSFDGEYQQLTGTGRAVRLPIRYYVMMGYNGNDIATNLKVVEVISFDERDSTKIRFGAPIFTISSAVQKYRLVFKYSDNSPFSLNHRLVLARKGSKKKKLMIVFDHLAAPANAAPTRMYSMGSDGSQDAMAWVNRVNDQRKGFFLLLIGVTPFEPGIEGYDPRLLRKMARDEERRLRNLGALPNRRDPASRNAAREDMRREQPGVAFPAQPAGGREVYDPQPAPAPAPAPTPAPGN